MIRFVACLLLTTVPLASSDDRLIAEGRNWASRASPRANCIKSCNEPPNSTPPIRRPFTPKATKDGNGE